MPKILTIISALILAAWFSLPAPAKAAPLITGADVGEDIIGSGAGKAYRSHRRYGRGDIFRGQPWGPGIHYSCAAFGSAAGYYSRWNPYYCRGAYAGYWGPVRAWWW